jgi:NAD(P)-dependent dehydrogenase (short-subunit alcohol dehydrogenase family)
MQNSAVEMNMTGYPALALYHKCMPGSPNKPEELANAILFLATAPSVNGAELAVDKGWLTC